MRSAQLLAEISIGWPLIVVIALVVIGGGLGGMAPERQSDIARLGLRAMLGGTIVNCMMGCIAGVLV